MLQCKNTGHFRGVLPAFLENEERQHDDRHATLSTPIAATRAAPRKGFSRASTTPSSRRACAPQCARLALHRHLIPEDLLKKAGYTATRRTTARILSRAKN
jgi:hypothetical protein